MIQTFPIILASGSPRRQELLKQLGIDFTVILKEIEESYPEHLKKEQVALFLARKKASAYNNETESGKVVITADTIVCINDKILNKPASFEEAVKMLELLSGRSHQVITGVCISGKEFSKLFHVVTTVTFKKLTLVEIKFYIDQYKPYDKAGGYGIQEWIGLIGLENIEGSYFNVVGLPVKELYENLVALKIINGI